MMTEKKGEAEARRIEDEMIEAAKKLRQHVALAGDGSIATIVLPSGLGAQLYCWITGGEPERPIQLTIGEANVWMSAGEAGLLMNVLEAMMNAASVFETLKHELPWGDTTCGLEN